MGKPATENTGPQEIKGMLSVRQKKYCHLYIVSKSCTEAARQAGYSEQTALKKASTWIRDTRAESASKDMFDYVKKLREDVENEFNITRGRLLKILANIAEFDPSEIFDDFGDLQPMSEWSKEARAAISGIEINETATLEGEILKTKIKKIKASDKVNAIAQISKMLGYNAPEKTQHDLGPSFIDFLKKSSQARQENRQIE